MLIVQALASLATGATSAMLIVLVEQHLNVPLPVALLVLFVYGLNTSTGMMVFNAIQ